MFFQQWEFSRHCIIRIIHHIIIVFGNAAYIFGLIELQTEAQ
jgi:hypothetical protein